MTTELRNYAARIGALFMPSDEAIGRYQGAVEDYAADRDAQSLRGRLMALDLDMATIDWHVANRGALMSCVCT